MDDTFGYAVLSFLDAFSGFHQISMYLPDAEKMTFITKKWTYCYQVMPFGLKNTGATYQQMVNKVFKELLGQVMKAYVDDMIVKRKQGESHARQLEKVFAVFRKNNMGLNPNKCAFGVKSGMFLGYLITHRGIEASLEKVQAVIDMQSPSSIKEVQRLMGRLTVLGRFLSKYAEHSLSFFKALKWGRNFQWTPECEKDFLELKEYLKEIPLLTRLEIGEKLCLYLGVSHQAVSAVLVRQVGQVDNPIYYVTKVLQEAESRYPYTEKIAPALVTAARKLRPYFQARYDSIAGSAFKADFIEI